MLGVQVGQIERLADLYARYRMPLFCFFVRLTGNRHLSEDLVQEVFLRVLKYRHTFKAGNSFRTWVHRIARNARHNAWRKGQHEVVGETEDLAQSEVLCSTDGGPGWDAGQSEEVARLEEALASLPLGSREVLMLTRFQGLKYEEVARVLGCSVGAVKMRVHRALQELRKSFSEVAGREAR